VQDGPVPSAPQSLTDSADRPADSLVLGPILRYVDQTSATVWLRTAGPARVRVSRAGRTWSATTFRVHDIHVALVVCDGLVPGSADTYEVSIDGAVVWPMPGMPPSRIRALDPARAPRFAYGSCRTAAPHDADGNRHHGIDALRALALVLREQPHASWPDLLLLLGDQVYADTTPQPELQEFMRARRDLDHPPHTEIKDFTEYAELYRLAWSEDVIRWMLSTVPSAMIFDDHDIRDDWNTSWAWREQIRRNPWWHERIVSGLGAYWVHQHLGNLSPAELAEEEIWRQIIGSAAPGGGTGPDAVVDVTDAVDALAERADARPGFYRWSHARTLGRSLLVVIDSRAARELRPGGRSMLDDEEWSWLDEVLRGGYEHVFVGTSLPFLLPPGLHDLEAIDEAIAHGGYGARAAHWAERLRQQVDLEHWAAFADGFDRLSDLVLALARGERGPAPRTVTFLSGDVHNSYVAEVVGRGELGLHSRIVQAVCSPIRHPMPHRIRVVVSLFARVLAGPMRAAATVSRHVRRPTYRWRVTEGPWFDNTIATCEVEPGGLWLRWHAGVVRGGQHTELREVRGIRIDAARHDDVPPGRAPAAGAPPQAADRPR
jgi:hypothetical protein